MSGADGSGKTTLAKLLSMYLARFGSVSTFWLRGSHLLASILLRVLSRLQVLRGMCNPYYKVCIPRRLRRIWFHIEFWSVMPYILLRYLLAMLHKFLISDRGITDFIVWIIMTLNYPSFLSSLYGRFLIRLAKGENIIYLYADRHVLTERADVPEEFVYRELAIYEVLTRYLAKCSVDTGRYRPVKAAARVLRCLNIA